MVGFQRLVRVEVNGQPAYGELLDSSDKGYSVKTLTGNPFDGFSSTGSVITADRLLAPLEHTPLFICIGLNYKQHAQEAKINVPPLPVVFTKPSDALAGPTDHVFIHPEAQPQLDYEGELCVIIGHDAKNVSEKDALQYVLGYTMGNDVSARNYQKPEVSGGQFCYAKSFDGFAPIGPAIWSRELIPDPQIVTYTTKVNGEIKQKTSTGDMIFTVRQIIAHCSRGTTIRKGTVIMTGTPSGVGLFQEKMLKDGDVVEIEAEGLGKIVNKMVFE